MTTITKDIQEAIERNLPAHLSSTLQTVLKAGEEDKAKVKSLSDALDKLKAEHKALNVTAISQEFDLKKHGELDIRIKAVEDKENKLRCKELELELAAEKRISTFATDTVSKLVRNVEFRENNFKSESIPVAMTNPGGYSTINTHPHSTSSSIQREIQ